MLNAGGPGSARFLQRIGSMPRAADLPARVMLLASTAPVAAAGASLAVIRLAPGGAGWCLAAGAAGLLAAAGAWAAGRQLKPLGAVRGRLAGVALRVGERQVYARAQADLDRNLALLRTTLHAHGEPRRAGDRLLFGDRVINDDVAAVDLVRAQAGGTATIFLGDRRVATNVVAASGGRAVGTTLADAAVRRRVLEEGRTFRGEAQILGRTFFTIYDPLVAGGEVIGILYVGVAKADFAARMEAIQSSVAHRGDTLGELATAAEVLETAVTGGVELDRETLDRRLADDDARRAQEIARQLAARTQAAVVATLSQALGQLAAGDLGCRIDALPPAYAQLCTDFNAAVDALRDTVEALGVAAGGVESGSGEIARAAADLSRRAEQQAAGLEETAAALDEITANVRMTAEGAQRAGEAVKAVRADAEGSGDQARRAVAAMDAVAKSSERIGGIVGVMDEIAFQTTLLALNAGVEAARAGEAGRGFAVVASEVRALAQRSGAAAKEIKALMAEASREVTGGVASVGEAGRALHRIADQVAAVDQVVAEIAAGTREQAQGLAQVNTAVNRMDQITQQNAAVAEESTAAAQALAAEAEGLSQLAARFDLGAPVANWSERRAA